MDESAEFDYADDFDDDARDGTGRAGSLLNPPTFRESIGLLAELRLIGDLGFVFVPLQRIKR